MKSFIETHRPRHDAAEQLAELVEATPRGVAAAFNSAFAATADIPVEKSRNLLDTYLRGDVREIYLDSLNRPQHYDSRQHDILAALIQETGTGVSDAEKSVLFHTWQRPTAAEDASKRRMRELTDRRHREAKQQAEDAETTLEGDSPPHEDEPSYETQGYGDKIII